MKAMAALLMTLTLSMGAFASDAQLNGTAFVTLLKARDSIALRGEVHSHETLISILADSVGSSNECTVKKTMATCELKIMHDPIGETSLIYETSADGSELLSHFIEVVRGD